MTVVKTHPFIDYLQSLVEGRERGALASLRHGLGRSPGETPEMFPLIVPRLPENPSRIQENAYYLVATLFALHPKSTREGNLGSHLAGSRNSGNDEALERRFVTLLSSHPDDLPNYLRQAISYLKSKDAPVNWDQLLLDVQAWEYPDSRLIVQKTWARAFWARQS